MFMIYNLKFQIFWQNRFLGYSVIILKGKNKLVCVILISPF